MNINIFFELFNIAGLNSWQYQLRSKCGTESDLFLQ